MSLDKAMERQEWAVSCMAIKPFDHVLESQLKKIRNRLPELLEDHGFKVQKTFDAKLNTTRAFGIQAR